MGLRAVNRMLPDEGVKPSYLPSVETPRPREPFDETAAADLREARPDFFIIGDSIAGTRIDPRHLSRRAGKSVAALLAPGSPVAYWYLEFKNLIVENGLTNMRGVIFFFRDDQLTTQVQVTPGVLDRVGGTASRTSIACWPRIASGLFRRSSRGPSPSISSIAPASGSSRGLTRAPVASWRPSRPGARIPRLDQYPGLSARAAACT